MNLIAKEVGQEAEVLGQLTDFLGKAKSFSPTKENLEGDKRIKFELVNKDGSAFDFTCSPRVSESLRKKEITLSNLGSLNVTLATSKDGQVFNMITMAGTKFDILAQVKAKPVAAKKFNPEELIAF